MPSVSLGPPPHGQGYSEKEYEQGDDVVGIGGHFVSILSHSQLALNDPKSIQLDRFQRIVVSIDLLFAQKPNGLALTRGAGDLRIKLTC